MARQYVNYWEKNNLDEISSISDYINTTDICMKDIMTLLKYRKIKEKIFLKERYIIPYETKDGDIVLMKQSKIDKYYKNL